MIEEYEKKFMTHEEYTVRPHNHFENGVIRRNAKYALGFLGIAAVGALAFGNGDSGSRAIACEGWTGFELEAGEPGFSAAITDVKFGEGVTQNDVTDAIALHNDTTNPIAGVRYEVPSRCTQAS